MNWVQRAPFVVFSQQVEEDEIVNRALNVTEWQFFNELKEGGVLKKFRPEHLEVSGALLAALICGDGDHSQDKFAFLGKISSRRHLLAANGGGHLIDLEYCVQKFGPAKGPIIHGFWLDQFLETHELKAPSVNVTKGHYRCGAATVKSGLTPKQSLFSMARSAFQLAELVPGSRIITSMEVPVVVNGDPLVLPLYHITNAHEKTYVIDVHDAFFGEVQLQFTASQGVRQLSHRTAAK